MKREDIVIYIAAGLFNARQNCFNSLLVESLEEKGYKTRFPQRDGFEFGRLDDSLKKVLPEAEVSSAVEDIIYFLDMGKFIPECNVVLANFDEPVDEGVIVEASYSCVMGKKVVGFRTDVRSPYGSVKDKFSGMHFFPGNQTDLFLIYPLPSRNSKESEEGIRGLVKRIDKAIISEDLKTREEFEESVRKNPVLERILTGATLLFEGIIDLHSPEGLNEISRRYVRNKSFFEIDAPKVSDYR